MRIAVVLFLVFFTGAAFAESAVDQRALDILKKMSDTLSGAKTVRFQARSMVPFKTSAGPWISLYGVSQIVMQGPDKLYVAASGDLSPHDFYYDGKTVTMFSPAKNLYAVKTAPATIDATLEEAFTNEGKSYPFADILVSKPYDVLTQDLTGALYVGQSDLRALSGSEAVKVDHLVISNKNVEWQIWIDTLDHLPRVVCATYLDAVNEPSYMVEFGSWKLDEPVSAETFSFNNTTNASKVEFRYPSQGKRGVQP